MGAEPKPVEAPKPVKQVEEVPPPRPVSYEAVIWHVAVLFKEIITIILFSFEVKPPELVAVNNVSHEDERYGIVQCVVCNGFICLVKFDVMWYGKCE